MNAKEMFEKLGWKLVDKPSLLPDTYGDAYDDDAIVYEHYLEGKPNCRLYFIELSTQCVYGFSIPNWMSVEIDLAEHIAIHQQMKELGWIE